MIFNSQEFLIFFSIVISVFFILPQKYRKYHILLASYFFYAWWNPLYIILILTSTLTDFIAGKKIYDSNNKSTKKRWLISSLIINIGILFLFKYVNFLAETFSIVDKNNKLINVLLPVGISFYTFQTISYTIDIYKQRLKPEKNFIYFALFVTYFPQLVAGPIERAGNILPQLKKKVSFNPERISQGLILIVYGFFQKVVIADNLAVFVDVVFNNPHNYQGMGIVIATLFFCFQIYNDFAGYTNIARGTALIMGVELSINFKQPYFAYSIQNFWQRWHISLSSWFKDYIYISLGGNKLPIPKWILTILMVFTISGIWHGADWTFIVWGFFNGLVYVLEKFLTDRKQKTNKFRHFIRIIINFIILNILWILFRSNSIGDAWIIYQNLIIPNFSIPFDTKWMLVCFLLIIINLIIDFFTRKKEIHKLLYEKPFLLKGSIIYSMLIAIFFIGNWHLTPFIYFQF